MEENILLMIILAFVLGCMCSGMMKNICGGKLVEGVEKKIKLFNKEITVNPTQTHHTQTPCNFDCSFMNELSDEDKYCKTMLYFLKDYVPSDCSYDHKVKSCCLNRLGN